MGGGDVISIVLWFFKILKLAKNASMTLDFPPGSSCRHIWVSFKTGKVTFLYANIGKSVGKG